MLHVGDAMGWWMLWGGLMMVLFWGTIIPMMNAPVTRMIRLTSANR